MLQAVVCDQHIDLGMRREQCAGRFDASASDEDRCVGSVSNQNRLVAETIGRAFHRFIDAFDRVFRSGCRAAIASRHHAGRIAFKSQRFEQGDHERGFARTPHGDISDHDHGHGHALGRIAKQSKAKSSSRDARSKKKRQRNERESTDRELQHAMAGCPSARPRVAVSEPDFL